MSPQHHLLRYPGAWAAPWTQESETGLACIAGAGDNLVGVSSSGIVSWLRPTTRELRASGSWSVTKAAVASNEKLFVLSAGHVRRVDGEQLRETSCSPLAASDLAASGERVWLISQGKLYYDDAAACQRVQDAPPHLRTVAASSALLGVVDDAGVGHIRGERGWQRLPWPRKRRTDALPVVNRLQMLVIGETTTHALDDEGNVYLLSEQPQ